MNKLSHLSKQDNAGECVGYGLHIGEEIVSGKPLFPGMIFLISIIFRWLLISLKNMSLWVICFCWGGEGRAYFSYRPSSWFDMI